MKRLPPTVAMSVVFAFAPLAHGQPNDERDTRSFEHWTETVAKYGPLRGQAVGKVTAALGGDESAEAAAELLNTLHISARVYGHTVKQNYVDSDGRVLPAYRSIVKFLLTESDRLKATHQHALSYLDFRDTLADQHGVLGDATRTTAARHKRYAGYIEVVSAVAEGRGQSHLDQTVRRVLRKSYRDRDAAKVYTQVLESVRAAIRNIEQQEARAQMLAAGTKKEATQLSAMLEGLDPAELEADFAALPGLTPSDGGEGSELYNGYERDWRDALGRRVDAYADLYRAYEKGTAKDMLKLCETDGPKAVDRYNDRLGEVKGWEAELVEALEKAEAWQKRQRSGVTEHPE